MACPTDCTDRIEALSERAEELAKVSSDAEAKRLRALAAELKEELIRAMLSDGDPWELAAAAADLGLAVAEAAHLEQRRRGGKARASQRAVTGFDRFLEWQ